MKTISPGSTSLTYFAFTRANALCGQTKPPAQIFVSAADFKPDEHRDENPPQNGGDDKGDEENGQIETEVLVGTSLGKAQEGDGTEAGGEHRDSDDEPVHVSATEKIVFVILLASGTSESQAKDHDKICGANAPIYEAQIGHEAENQQ